MRNRLVSLFEGVVLSLLLSGCSNNAGTFYYGALGRGQQRLVISTQNTGAYTVLSYGLTGKIPRVLADSTLDNDIPKGIAQFDPFSYAVLYDGKDRLARISALGESLPPIATNVALTGTLYQLALERETSRYFAIESNTIEAFSMDGDRIGNPFIPATLGACTLSTPRGVAVSSDGRLAVVNSGNHRLLIYDVTGSSPVCLSSNSALAANSPTSVLFHSSGQILVATQGNDRIYSFPTDCSGSGTIVWNTNTTRINNPTAMVEMPDSSILVASDGTNSIEQLNLDGTILPASFIRDAFTGLVTDMLVTRAE